MNYKLCIMNWLWAFRQAVGLSAISFSAPLQKDAAPIPNASFLFRDGAHRHTIVSFVSTLALTTIVEIEEVREVIVDVIVWRRTPKASVDASIAKHNSVATTRSRKEDTVAIRSYNFCAAHSVYSGPFPCTIVYKFLALLFCRQPPSSTPIGSSSIVWWCKIASSVHIALRL